MNTEDIPSAPITIWYPEKNQVVLAAIGKLGEEASELAAKCCRIVISGLDEPNPDNGKSNRQELQDEIADVEAMISHVHTIMKTDLKAMDLRSRHKFTYKEAWFDALRKHFDFWGKA